jgi:hypothetical protein
MTTTITRCEEDRTMAWFRPFKPSNMLGTCLWCGREIKPHDGRTGVKFEKQPGVTLVGICYGTPYFCTLTCGLQFAHTQAANGRRLQHQQRAEPVKEPPPC